MTLLSAQFPLDDPALEFVLSKLVEVEATSAPGLVLPRSYGGHLVRSDAHADLLHLCALLVTCGVESVAGVNLRRRAHELLMELRADEVEGFSAYRVAEAITLLGGISTLGVRARDHAISATASPQLLQAVAAGAEARRPNFIVVAARCVHARRRLGLVDDARQDATVLDRARGLFEEASAGWINDGRGGEVHFDIYTPEMYLLAEPLREVIAPRWCDGFRRVLSDIEVLAQPHGVISWGRSVGVLSLAMSVQLSVLAVLHELAVDRDWWRTVGEAATRDLQGWFHRGVVNAHQSRACGPYRGPARRLQLTFDLFGKLTWCALRRQEFSRRSLPSGQPKPPSFVDELVRLPQGAGAWAHRSPGIAFVLPLMASRTPAYVPSPRAEGLFEQPVTGFPLLVPTVSAALGGGTECHYVPAGPPTKIEHRPSGLAVHQEGWVALGRPPSDALSGHRRAEYRVVGRGLEVTEDITIDAPPPGSVLSLMVGDVPHEHLRFACDVGERPTTVDTAGMAEWQTHWSELQRVQQVTVALEPPARLRFRWSVTRSLRVATTEPAHQYSRSLYEHMPHVSVVPSGPPDDDLGRRLRGVHVLHIAWPERWTGMDLTRTERAIRQIRASGARIVWTQHNLLPHRDRSINAQRVYGLWAEAADAVIHHSTYARSRAVSQYRYPNAEHFVIPHGHWGAWFPTPRPERAEVEDEEGWPATATRYAIIGRPRHDKQLQTVLDAFGSTSREDIQLVARLSAGIRVPDDPRVIPNYGLVNRERYYRRLCAVDGLILPFTGETMLTTGTAFDAIGGGIGVLASPWGFLAETFGSAALWYDGSAQRLVGLLSALSAEDLKAAGAASASLQARHDWAMIGAETASAFEQVAHAGSPS